MSYKYKKNKKLIIYELNELPPRLLFFYSKLKPKSSIAKLISQGMFLETITHDSGELHPWTTWPTVHRGIGREIHGINFLNQPLDHLVNYPPVWEILQNNNITTGVFGSLHSYIDKFSSKNISFRLPDTFAKDAKASHEGLRLFQEFNLQLTQQNKATQRSIGITQLKQLLILILKKELSIGPPLETIKHLIKEFFDSKYKPRRPLLQASFTFDIYKKYLVKYQPEFSTFFTNHLASMMHRYWKYLFPGDQLVDISRFQSKSIIKAMDIADRQIADLLSIGKKYGYQLWIISSMGQEEISRGEYIPEICILDFNPILKILDLDEDKYEMLPAMQPDICIKAKDKISLQKLIDKLNYLCDSDNQPILDLRYKPIGNTVNLFINNNKAIPKYKEIIYGGKKYHISDLSIELISRDIGTGYHVPNGVLLSEYPIISNKAPFDVNQILDTRKILPLILDFYKLNKSNYML